MSSNEINPQKDFNGIDLKVGDKVAFIPAGYRSFKIGIIVGFTKSLIQIECEGNKCKRDPYLVCKYPF